MKILTLIIVVGISIPAISQEHLKHDQWTNLLKTYVSSTGNVDYKGIKEHEAELDAYLAVLSANHPTADWDKNDQLAFWINAYNAFTVKLIVKNYPVVSIKDLGGSVYKVNTPWDEKFIKIGDQTYDLNNIEHGIIRKDFADPRIHFAVNCASISCPPLRNEAYVGSKLNVQLDDQARKFINDSTKNKITKNKATLSKIFTWFKGDFTASGLSIAEFINQYSEVKMTKKTKVTYFEYDWNLNGK